ncbi:MAG: hypothetical protein ABI638_10000 [Ignavibacteriota bacterium]
MEETKIVIFKNKAIRKSLYNNEWWFSIIDVVEVLTDSPNPRDYWFKMKIRVKDEDGFQLSTICRQLKLIAGDARKQLEKRLGRSVVSKNNFLIETERKKLLKSKE